MAEERDIKYINRDFNDLKTSLIEHAKNYFPDSYNDFSPTSPGTMLDGSIRWGCFIFLSR